MRTGSWAENAGRVTAGLVLLAAAGCHEQGPQRHEGTPSGAGGAAWTVTGMVQHVEVEGGFYGILVDDGTKLDPVNLPEDFRQDGVRVRVRVIEVRDAVSTHMWGKVVRILEIERLRPREEQ
jgi:hypothetical protein